MLQEQRARISASQIEAMWEITNPVFLSECIGDIKFIAAVPPAIFREGTVIVAQVSLHGFDEGDRTFQGRGNTVEAALRDLRSDLWGAFLPRPMPPVIDSRCPVLA